MQAQRLFLSLLSVQTLFGAFRLLIANGATAVGIEHDPDVMRHADRLIDLGPGGNGRCRIVFAGIPEEIHRCPGFTTGKHL